MLLERMKKINEEGEEETTEEERLKRFNKIEIQSAESKYTKKGGGVSGRGPKNVNIAFRFADKLPNTLF